MKDPSELKVPTTNQPQPIELTACELDQLKLVSEYIKFHLGLYLATPPVLAVVAESLGVEHHLLTILGLLLTIGCCLASGVSAGLFMGKFVNTKWHGNRELPLLYEEAFGSDRRQMQHGLYWVGVIGGLGFLAAACLATLLGWRG